MKLLPIEICSECGFSMFYLDLGDTCVHPKLIEKYPDPKDRPTGIPFRHDCPLEDEK